MENYMENWFVSEKVEDYGNPVLDKSFQFGVTIVKFYTAQIKSNYQFRDLFRQLLRSGTSIGANITEAQEAASRKDFKNKLTIALKEAKETEYWLNILFNSTTINEIEYKNLINYCHEIIRLLISIIKKLKEE